MGNLMQCVTARTTSYKLEIFPTFEFEFDKNKVYANCLIIFLLKKTSEYINIPGRWVVHGYYTYRMSSGEV